MLRILGGEASSACDGISRREVLRAGGLSLFGSMTLPRLLRAAAQSPATQAGAGRVKSIILLNLYGGPPHLDMFDMKPEAPAEIRGEFRPIATSVPGLSVCEHLPKLAQLMHKGTLIRSVTHKYNSHNPYALLTGFDGGNDRENYYTKRTDHPGIPAVCQYLGLGRPDMPGSVFLPALPGFSQGLRRAGPYGGYLGRQFDPMFSDCDAKFDRDFVFEQAFYEGYAPIGEPRLPSIDALPELTVDRFRHRASLLREVDHQYASLEKSREFSTLDQFQRKAVDMLTSSRARSAFDLSEEPETVRQSYGKSLYGTSMLIARRLVEAGVVFVGVTTESRGGGHWDSHEKNFSLLKGFNLPNLDEIGSALIQDMDRRGLLESTLVVMMGEMGRAPRVNGKAGRDHWPQCGFALLFGGGVKEGCVLGGSDKIGAHVNDSPVSPGDIVATMYHMLGVDSQMTVNDLDGRPILIAHGGQPIEAILA